MQINIADLIMQAQNSDRNAYSKLYQLSFKKTHYLVSKLINDEQSVSEILIRSYSDAFNNLGSLKHPENYEKWITQIAAIKCIEFIKAEKGGVVFSEKKAIVNEVINNQTEFLPKALINSSNADIITSKIIDSFSDLQKTVVVLYYFAEMSVQKIAKLTGCTVDEAENELFSAKISFKNTIDRMINRQTPLYPSAKTPVLTSIMNNASQKQTVNEEELRFIFNSVINSIYQPETTITEPRLPEIKKNKDKIKKEPEIILKLKTLTQSKKIIASVCIFLAVALAIGGVFGIPKLIASNSNNESAIGDISVQQTVPEPNSELLAALEPYATNYKDTLKTCREKIEEITVKYSYSYEDMAFVFDYVDDNDIPDLVMFGKNYHDKTKSDGNNFAFIVLNGNYSDLTESDTAFEVYGIENETFWIGKKGHFITKSAQNDENEQNYSICYSENIFGGSIKNSRQSSVLTYKKFLDDTTNLYEEFWIYSDRTIPEDFVLNGWDEFNNKKEEMLKGYYQLDSGYSLEEFVNSGKTLVEFLKDAKIKFFGILSNKEPERTSAVTTSEFTTESTTEPLTVTVNVKWKESSVLNSYASIEYYSEKTNIIKMADTGYYGLIDAKGNVVIQPKPSQYFDYCSYGSGNIHYILSETEGGEGFEIDMDNYTVDSEMHGGHGANDDSIPAGFDDIDRYFNGLAAAKKNGKWGYIDKSNNIIIPVEYEGIEEGFIVDNCRAFDGEYIPVKKNGKMGIINKQNQIVVPFEYDVIMQGENGIFIARRNGRWGFIGIGVEPKEPQKAVNSKAKPEWETNYNKLLKEYSNHYNMRFTLVDVDSNEIPDLILFDRSAQTDFCYIYLNGNTDEEESIIISATDIYLTLSGEIGYYYNYHSGEEYCDSYHKCSFDGNDLNSTEFASHFCGYENAETKTGTLEYWEYIDATQGLKNEIDKAEYDAFVEDFNNEYSKVNDYSVTEYLESNDALDKYIQTY